MAENGSRQRAKVPAKALWISAVALAVPMLGGIAFPDSLGDYGALLWLLGLIPAFLLAYYRGWRGVATALAAGMAALALTQVLASSFGLVIPNLLFGIVVAYIAISLGIGWLAEVMHRDKDRVEDMAYTDGLTRLPNRRHARFFLENEFSAAGRGRMLCAVLFDLDHFKTYNDTYGHAAGDDALKTFGDILARTTRRSNLSARFGGEEFVSILAGTSAEGAMVFAERVRTMIRGHKLGTPPLTVSAGVATYHPSMRSPDELLAAADHALYQAKRAGRDRVKLFGRALTALKPDSTGIDEHPFGEAEGEPEGEYPRSPEELGRTHPGAGLLPEEASGFGKGRRVLVIEADGGLRTGTTDYLSKQGFIVEAAADAPEAILALRQEFDVAIAGYPLPSATGHDMVATVKSRWPATQVISLGKDNQGTMAEALRAGADRFLPKPFDVERLRTEMAQSLRRRDRVVAERLEMRLLSVETRERQDRAWTEIFQGLRVLVFAAETRDPYTKGHGDRTAAFARAIGRSFVKRGGTIDLYTLELGCHVHDLGKIHVPDEILNREGSLEEEEWRLLQAHCKIGRGIVEPIVGDDDVLAAVTWHHERWDGSGYPDKLAGDAIPLVARIAAIADTLSALVSGRPYRRASSWPEALDSVRNDFGSSFDPGLAEAFEDAVPEMTEIFQRTGNAER
jgi:putative two-component system response regulator